MDFKKQHSKLICLLLLTLIFAVAYGLPSARAEGAGDYVSYVTNHPTWGSYASFVLGRPGQGGGFALSDVAPPDNDIFLGFQKSGEKPQLFPFIRFPFSSDVAQVYKKTEFIRELGWASDLWQTKGFTFKIYTPFGSVKDPATMTADEMKQTVCPGMVARITLDNTQSTKSATIYFGLGGFDKRLSELTGGKLLGGCSDGAAAFACRAESGIKEYIGYDVLKKIFTGRTVETTTGREVVLALSVPANSVKTFTLALCTYQGKMVTTGVTARLAYTQYYKDILDVAGYTLDHQEQLVQSAEEKDHELRASGLNPYKQFLIAQSTHSYLASTELLRDEEGHPLWVVNEGEYRMINTFDLTVDHIYWEMKYHPWTVRNVLDLYLDRYSYRDTVKDNQGNEYPGGLSFTHDMGVANKFSKPGYSYYEKPELTSTFSYMTAEQLLNWVLCASVYGLDADPAWLDSRKQTLIDCYASILARDLNHDGIIDADSTRCGKVGTEITTYDSLDASLGQARNNLYIAVKTWGAYVCLENDFKRLGMADYARRAGESASTIADSIASKYDAEAKFIPAVFENNNRSRIVPAIEGLIYPYVIKDMDAVSPDGRFGKFVRILKEHFKTVLKKGVCIDEFSGGWKLSSTSNITWYSKNALNQYIAENVLKMDFGDEAVNWDRVYVSWQAGTLGPLGSTDQINSVTGQYMGSCLYPRLITSALWMK